MSMPEDDLVRRVEMVSDRVEMVSDLVEMLDKRVEMLDKRVEMVDKRVEAVHKRVEMVNDRTDDLRRNFYNLSEAVDRVKENLSGHVSDSTLHHSHWWLDLEPKEGDLEGLAKLFAARGSVPDTK